jgi:hypothetical protein
MEGGDPNTMTTMQEALADKFLSAAEVPEFLAQTNDLMQRSFQNPKYGAEGQSIKAGAEGGIPSKHQNKARSGRSARKSANGRRDLEAVGGLSYRGPWDALKASEKPADYALCKLEQEVKSRPAGTHNPRAARSYNADGTVTSGDKMPKRSLLSEDLMAKFKVQS